MSYRITVSVWATLAVAQNDMEIVIVGATLAVAQIKYNEEDCVE